VGGPQASLKTWWQREKFRAPAGNRTPVVQPAAQVLYWLRHPACCATATAADASAALSSEIKTWKQKHEQISSLVHKGAHWERLLPREIHRTDKMETKCMPSYTAHCKLFYDKSDWLWAGPLDDRYSNLGGGWEFFSSTPRPAGSGAHPASYPVGTSGSFPGG
jgi:hypothetical protein